MSADNPPTFNFSGIDFNNTYFLNENNTNLTKAQADNYYLNKQIPDTATVLETFNSGINALSISPLAIGSGLTIAGTQTSGNLNLGSGTGIITGAINISTGLVTGLNQTVNIGSSSITSGTQFINLGGVNTFTTGSQTVRLNRPLTLNYNSLPILTDLGYYVNYTSTSQPVSSGINNNINSFQIETSGLYCVSCQIIFTIGTNAIRFTRQRFGIQQTTGTYLNNLYQSRIGTYDMPASSDYVESFSGIYRFTGTSNYFLICDSLFTLSTLSANGNVVITRIG